MEDQQLNLEQIKSLPAAEAVEKLSELISQNPDFEEAYIQRGLKYWSMGQRREAINDYLAALKINPDSKAKMALDYANSILDYYNKDLLNP